LRDGGVAERESGQSRGGEAREQGGQCETSINNCFIVKKLLNILATSCNFSHGGTGIPLRLSSSSLGGRVRVRPGWSPEVCGTGHGGARIGARQGRGGEAREQGGQCETSNNNCFIIKELWNILAISSNFAHGVAGIPLRLPSSSLGGGVRVRPGWSPEVCGTGHGGARIGAGQGRGGEGRRGNRAGNARRVSITAPLSKSYGIYWQQAATLHMVGPKFLCASRPHLWAEGFESGQDGSPEACGTGHGGARIGTGQGRRGNRAGNARRVSITASLSKSYGIYWQQAVTSHMVWPEFLCAYRPHLWAEGLESGQVGLPEACGTVHGGARIGAGQGRRGNRAGNVK
jgi:hypothetical protein